MPLWEYSHSMGREMLPQVTPSFLTATPDTGTYTVNSDCTGTTTDATIDVHFNIVTVGGGAEVFGIETDEGFTATFDAKKQ
jgi:hypothetical protein